MNTPRGVRLGGGHQAWLYGSFGLLFVSGAGWLAARGWFASAEGLPGSAEAGWLKLHGAAAMVSLVALGSVLPQHVRRAWARRRNRASGAAFVGLNLALAATGWGLYYAGDEAARLWVSRAHCAAGVAFPALLAWHVWAGRRAGSQRSSASNTAAGGGPAAGGR